MRNDSGTFTALVLPDSLRESPGAAAAALGDFDGDGFVDLFTANRLFIANQFYTRMYTRGFAEQGRLISSLSSGRDSFAAVPFDYDNDGDLDLFVANARRADRVYMNQGDGTFVDMAPALGMADSAQALSVMLGDYDNDGDLDVYVVNEGSANRLYQNGGSPHTWMQVNLRGVQSNIDGIGARLHMFSGSQVQMREVNGAAGFSHSSRTAHFGIGSSARADSLVVRWPNVQVDRHLDIAAGNALQLTEGQIPTTNRRSGRASAAPFCPGAELSQSFQQRYCYPLRSAPKLARRLGSLQPDGSAGVHPGRRPAPSRQVRRALGWPRRPGADYGFRRVPVSPAGRSTGRDAQTIAGAIVGTRNEPRKCDGGRGFYGCLE